MRRLAPRPLGAALEGFSREGAPAGLLSRVQGRWAAVVGRLIAAESEPVSEREGVVTVACESSVWAHELELLGDDLRGRLNAELGPGEPVRKLRFRVARR